MMKSNMGLEKAYEAERYEKDIYRLWEESGIFKADPSSDKEHFSISMPPPNETGTLSLGHALFLTLQDIMSRNARQEGKDVLWLPGTDHAALPVNAIIEKQLAEEGTNKHQIGREAFLKRTREFVGNSRDTMLGQMRAMGASVDWSRLRYTLDDALSRCVNETFVRMYKDGLIYRGNRIVNWDPNLATNVSDDEVSYVEEKGKFYTLKYGPFEIGTARPETKFGDKYVVMHPDDKRYTDYKHGDTIEVEWINGKITATIIKDEAVDPDFGTGVMTITPWHSLVDFEIAERHNLDKEQIIDFDGKLLPIAQEFSGLSIDEARPKIVEKLASKGLLVKVDDNYIHNIAVNERGRGVIEPQIRLQWFIDVNKPAVDWKGKKLSLKEVLQSVIKDEDIKLLPERFEKVYFHWIDNLRDWCISRQIWWGHRIPVWYKHKNDGKEIYVGVRPPDNADDWEQDPDTLDTWFSSALWTWSTLVDPTKAQDYSLDLDNLLKQSPDFMAYHPTSIMETGWDILFFWVARMILATTYITHEVPFKQVYLHGLIKAEDGKKMSKSRPESIIDPLDVTSRYGTDALRMALIMSVTPGNDQSWAYSKVEANQKFANKIWNVARYIEGAIGDKSDRQSAEPKSVVDHWILDRLDYSQRQIENNLDNFRFSEAYDNLYHFIWNELADWYVEASKQEINQPLLAYLLENTLILAHPFAPFVTEAIWQQLGWEENSILASRCRQQIISSDKDSAKEFNIVKELVTEVRFILKALNISGVKLICQDAPTVINNADVIKGLTRISEVREGEGKGIRLTNSPYKCWLEVDKNDTTNYLDSLRNKQTKQTSYIKQLEIRLDNKQYVSSAPEELVTETRRQLDLAKKQLAVIAKEIKQFSI